MPERSRAGVLQNSILKYGWNVGETKDTRQIDEKFIEIRRGLSQGQIKYVLKDMKCFSVELGHQGLTLNKYTRISLPGNICKDCKFNPKSTNYSQTVSCKILESNKI